MPLTASYILTVVMAYRRPAAGVEIGGLLIRTVSNASSIQRVTVLPAEALTTLPKITAAPVSRNRNLRINLLLRTKTS
jgi:hypothetical protein